MAPIAIHIGADIPAIAVPTATNAPLIAPSTAIIVVLLVIAPNAATIAPSPIITGPVAAANTPNIPIIALIGAGACEIIWISGVKPFIINVIIGAKAPPMLIPKSRKLFMNIFI